MRFYCSISLTLSAAVLLSSCSNDKPSTHFPVKSGAEPEEETYGEQAKLFAPTSASPESAKPFLADAALGFRVTATQLTLNRPDGTSLVYERSNGQWGVAESFSDSANYKVVYAYHDGSFVGLTTSVLNLRVGTGRLLSYDMAQTLPEGSKVLGTGPGFFAAVLSDGIMVLQGDGTAAKSIKIKGFPEGLIGVSPCVSGCIVWGQDATNALYTYGEDNVWTKRPLPFTVPEGKTYIRLALNLKIDAKDLLIVDHAALLTHDGQIFVSQYGGTSDKVVTFEEVKGLATRYCISCHSADAFDQETGLKAYKTKIINRLTLESSNPQVMPPGSAPKPMPATDKAIVVSWLKTQTVGVDQEPSGGGGGAAPEDKTKIAVTGVLATQGEKYCVSCHPTAKFQAFWYNGQSDVLSRVTSGNMPAGKTMPEADKAALLKAVSELN